MRDKNDNLLKIPKTTGARKTIFGINFTFLGCHSYIGKNYLKIMENDVFFYFSLRTIFLRTSQQYRIETS